MLDITHIYILSYESRSLWEDKIEKYFTDLETLLKFVNSNLIESYRITKVPLYSNV